MAKTGFKRKTIKNISASKKGNVKNRNKIFDAQKPFVYIFETTRRYCSLCPVHFLLFVDLIKEITI